MLRMTGVAEALNGMARRVPPWALYLIGPLPAAWFFWLGLTGALGPEPIKALEHRLGELALQLLLAGLAVTPLRRHFGVNLIRLRRAVGLLAFFYVTLHLLVWLLLDIGIWSQILADILKRPYITIGMAGYALLIPLAVTSNNWSVRRLGPAWRRLHRLTYAAVLLGAVHYVMLVKGWQIEPLLYLCAALGLLLLRLPLQRRRTARS
jgi:sulfoxide reductase heme-binding subunit YedZ